MRDARRDFWSDGGRGERGGRRREGRVNAESRRTAATEEEATAPSRGDYARGERTRPTGKNGARRPRASASRLGTSRTRMKTRGSSSSSKKTTSRRGSPSSSKKTTSRRRSCSIRALPAPGAQCDARPTGADTAVQVRMDADEDSVEPRVVLRINVVDDRPIDEPRRRDENGGR